MLVVTGVADGVGCTTVAVALAAWSARRRPTLLVDVPGAAATCLGVAGCSTGLDAWLATAAPPPTALLDLERRVGPRLALLASESSEGGVAAADWWSEASEDRLALLAALLIADERAVVADVGPLGSASSALLTAGSPTLVVARSGRGAAVSNEVIDDSVDGVVVIEEGAGRPTAPTVASALGLPLVARVRHARSVAAAGRAGTVARRPPRALAPLRAVVA